MPGLLISLGLPLRTTGSSVLAAPRLRLRGSAQQPQGLGAPRLVESARVGAEPTSPTPAPPGKPRSAGFSSSCARSCLTLRSPADCSRPGSSVHGVSQVRIPEWAAISSCRDSFPLRESNPRLWQADSLTPSQLESLFSS